MKTILTKTGRANLRNMALDDSIPLDMIPVMQRLVIDLLNDFETLKIDAEALRHDIEKLTVEN